MHLARRKSHSRDAIAGRSKAAAEEGAAREMLELYGHDIYNAPSQNSKKEKTKKDLKGKCVWTVTYARRRVQLQHYLSGE